MTSREFVIDSMRRWGKTAAEALQIKAPEMTGTELNAEEKYIPGFRSACAHRNMKERKAGFVCKTAVGRVVKLLQPYDSTVYTAEPEELPSLWGFVWSNDPAHALPFVAISTSPYMKGNCCTEGGKVYRSLNDNNVHAPSAWPQGWEAVTDEG